MKFALRTTDTNLERLQVRMKDLLPDLKLELTEDSSGGRYIVCTEEFDSLDNPLAWVTVNSMLRGFEQFVYVEKAISVLPKGEYRFESHLEHIQRMHRERREALHVDPAFL